MTVTNVTDLFIKIAEKEAELEKLKEQLNSLPELKLSSVYENSLAYGVCYEDGHGTLETLEVMNNVPGRLQSLARQRAKDFFNNRLYIVGFQPVTIITCVEAKNVT